jgi:hypothetical protein
MRRFLSAVFCLMLGANAWAIPELTTVGQGTYRYLFWQLYDARLATADGKFAGYQHNTPLMLELTYKRDISREQFIEATVDEWSKLGGSNKAQHSAWASRLQALWQDVKKGDRLAAVLLSDGRVTFYFNDSKTGTIEDTAFGSAFFDIWLHPETSAPALRRALIATQ